LRRAVNGILRIVNKFEFEFDIIETIRELAFSYVQINIEKLENFILERVKRYYDVNPSIIEAVLASGERDLLALGRKIQALNNLVNSEGFNEVSSTFKRVANITKDVDLSVESLVDNELFEEDAEKILYTKFNEVNMQEYDDYEAELDALLGLKPELDNFFTNVMVNVDDENTKNNRKALISNIYKSILKIADIKEVSV